MREFNRQIRPVAKKIFQRSKLPWQPEERFCQINGQFFRLRREFAAMQAGIRLGPLGQEDQRNPFTKRLDRSA